jgi:hypothetical protein
MGFIKTPNLPQSDVTLVAISGTYAKIIHALHLLGIETIAIEPCGRLSNAINSHADMLCHHLGGNQVIVEQGEKSLKLKLESYGFEVINSNRCVSKLYPYDVLFNAARMGNQIIANQGALDDTVIDHCKENAIKIINVKQGYAKCSTIVVDNHSIITADSSIVKAAQKAQIDTLQIEQGNIILPGCSYGFIGGTCGFISKNKIAFTGNIKTHPSYEKIKMFLDKREIKMICLTDDQIIDIGGVIPLKEM